MSNASQEVYHCPSCGSLASVAPGDQGGKICGECGFEFGQPLAISPRSSRQQVQTSGGFVQRDVSSRRRIAARVEAVIPAEVLPPSDLEESGSESGAREVQKEVISDDGRKKIVRRRRKRRRNRTAPLLFLCGWAVLVMLVVILVQNHGRKSSVSLENPRERAALELRAKQGEALAFLDKESAGCAQTLGGFLAARTTAERAQYVYNGKKLVTIMADFYSANLPWAVPRNGRVEVKTTNLYMRGERPAIETVWAVVELTEKEKKARKEAEELQSGEKATAEVGGEDEPLGEEQKEQEKWQDQPDLEVAFVKIGDQWLLDWEGFVRYSSEAWPRFLEGTGDPRGTFRVYMRKGLDVAQQGTPLIQVQFFPPRSDDKVWKRGSEWVQVELTSESGRRIQSILNKAKKRKKKRALGESLFGAEDPAELHRVRVELQWVSSSGERILRLNKVLAGNWYGEGLEEQFDQPSPAEVAGEGVGSFEGEAYEKDPADGGVG